MKIKKKKKKKLKTLHNVLKSKKYIFFFSTYSKNLLIHKTENIHKEKQRGCPLLGANRYTHIYISYICVYILFICLRL